MTIDSKKDGLESAVEAPVLGETAVSVADGLPVALEVNEVLDGGVCSDLAEAVEGLDEGARVDLQFVTRFFDVAVRELGLEGADFFSNEVAREDFRKRLGEFNVYLDEELAEVASLEQRHRKYSNFGESWKSNLRKAAFYAFFIHYGAKREGERQKKEDGSVEPKDYVYHVTRSCFNNWLEKYRFFDERSSVMGILHDTREDYRKGFFGLLQLDDADLSGVITRDQGALKKFKGKGKALAGSEMGERILAKMSEMEASLDVAIGPRDPEATCSVSELVDLMTKTGSDRNRSLLEMLAQICSYENLSKRFDAIKAFKYKGYGDRLDNLRTLLATKGQKAHERIKAIEDETVLIFLAEAFLDRAINIADWFADYIHFTDHSKRSKWQRLRDRPDAGENPEERRVLVRQFMNEFHTKLCEYMGTEDLQRGRDYRLEFRPIGMRYEQFEDAQALADQGRYNRAFRNYIMFSPVAGQGRTLVGQAHMREMAKKVFCEIFDGDLPSEILERRELQTALGQCVLDGRVVPLEKNGLSEKFGVGIWGVFDNDEQAVAVMMGQYHYAYFMGRDGEIDRKGVLKRFRGIALEVNHLLHQYNFLDQQDAGVDKNSEPSRISMEIQRRLMEALGEEFPPGFASVDPAVVMQRVNIEALDPEKITQCREDLGLLVRMIFASQKVEKEVVLDGVEYEAMFPVRAELLAEGLPWISVLPLAGVRVSWESEGGRSVNRKIAKGTRSALHYYADLYRNSVLDQEFRYGGRRVKLVSGLCIW